MSSKLKLVLSILCPIIGIVAGIIAIANGLLDRQTKKKQREAWEKPSEMFQNIGVGIEFQRQREANKKT